MMVSPTLLGTFELKKKHNKTDARKAWLLVRNFPGSTDYLQLRAAPTSLLGKKMPFISLVSWHFVETQQRLWHIQPFWSLTNLIYEPAYPQLRPIYQNLCETPTHLFFKCL